MSSVVLQMVCVAGLLGLAILAIVLSRSKISTAVIYSATLAVSAIALIGSIRWLLGDMANATDLTLPIGLPWLGAHFRLDALASFFPCCRQSGRSGSKPLWSRLRPPRSRAAARASVLPRLSGRYESGGAGG